MIHGVGVQRDTQIGWTDWEKQIEPCVDIQERPNSTMGRIHRGKQLRVGCGYMESFFYSHRH